MTILRIDDQTAAGLASLAAANGLSVEDYLRHLATPTTTAGEAEMSAEEFDREIERLSFRGPSLPDDFSRADIYSEHD